MSIKKFKPTTPSRRHMTVLSFEELSKKQPEKQNTHWWQSRGCLNCQPHAIPLLGIAAIYTP